MKSICWTIISAANSRLGFTRGETTEQSIVPGTTTPVGGDSSLLLWCHTGVFASSRWVCHSSEQQAEQECCSTCRNCSWCDPNSKNSFLCCLFLITILPVSAYDPPTKQRCVQDTLEIQKSRPLTLEKCLEWIRLGLVAASPASGDNNVTDGD